MGVPASRMAALGSEVMTDASGERPEASGPDAEPGNALAPDTAALRIDVRAAARERARELRALQRRKDRRNRWLLRGVIVGGTVLVLAAISVVLFSFVQPSGRAPQTMRDDGITIGEGLLPVEAASGLEPGATPTPAATPGGEVIDIRLYVDYLSATAGDFEKTNGEQIEQLVSSGAATLEVHPVALLTGKSAGTQYSLRSANAAACVAEFSPENFFAFNRALLLDQPVEGEPGLEDTEIIDRAEGAGVGSLALVRNCIESNRFRAWVQAATERVQSEPIPGTEVEGITTAPAVFVNGQQFQYVADGDPNAFAQFIVQVAGQSFNESQLPTESPTPTPTPTRGAED